MQSAVLVVVVDEAADASEILLIMDIASPQVGMGYGGWRMENGERGRLLRAIVKKLKLL
jgi:hypothetical protein